jgi:putative membrane protein
MTNYFYLILKGIAMGAANVIPGVSGGTMALITGIFERLIDAIKSFNTKAIKLLFSLQLKAFARHTDLYFLIAVFAGIAIAIVTLARVFDYLFTNYPVYIWAYFFGLVLASVYFVGKTIQHWTVSVVVAFIIGTTGAVIISVLNPATENSSIIYLLLCGVVAMCSMILPGLSGSFVLILMGNYQLVMIDAINNRDLTILIPVVIGAGVGLLAFSHILSWVFKKFRDQTISLLTGFILGSVSILWPWQNMIYMKDEAGELVSKNGEPIVISYERYIPDSFTTEVVFAILIVLLGVVSIWAIEKAAEVKPT